MVQNCLKRTFIAEVTQAKVPEKPDSPVPSPQFSTGPYNPLAQIFLLECDRFVVVISHAGHDRPTGGSSSSIVSLPKPETTFLISKFLIFLNEKSLPMLVRVDLGSSTEPHN